ncbi:uncharacterized protein BP01DRAFT_384891 [Aspergillus saccharolyticus JOP 1030-1]|uniref:Uncharacterized protein n=1 Tax=Aspergillus saccharolyticus JOP 1030-1 TaxID=1450539 RepID=A0A318ZS79_9EURO|nr:hypothetical protein BP01DRAFT_384891 [Aspergillus saccharolyticus JOP 1030-1]PYH42938.1 hypothetical protein BP01DRAFT_384891 [Aspergillus saccharolyticus JOP 1030-1]
MIEKPEKLAYWKQRLTQIYPGRWGYRIRTVYPIPERSETGSPYLKLVVSYRGEPFLVFLVANAGSWTELEHSMKKELWVLRNRSWRRRRGVIANGVLVRFYRLQPPGILKAIGDPENTYREDEGDRRAIDRSLTFYKKAIQSDMQRERVMLQSSFSPSDDCLRSLPGFFDLARDVFVATQYRSPYIPHAN